LGNPKALAEGDGKGEIFPIGLGCFENLDLKLDYFTINL
jgi:hypothetical protein